LVRGGLAAAFGSGAMTNAIAEIEDAGCIFVIGSNTTANHPLVSRRIFKAKEKGAKLIVADPRNIQLSRFADVAVNQRLGSDVALLNGMMHVIVRNGWQDEAYIDQRTEGYEKLEKLVSQFPASTVSQTELSEGEEIPVEIENNKAIQPFESGSAISKRKAKNINNIVLYR